MAQIIFRRGGWYSDFRIGGKRIRRFLSKDKRSAQIELGYLIEKLRLDSRGRPNRNIKWVDFKKRYFAYAEGNKKPNSVKRDRAAIGSFEKKFVINRLDEVTPELLERWKALRLVDGLGKPSINRDVSAIKALLRKAESWNYLDKRDWSSVKLLRTTRKKLYFHTIEDLKLLLSKCHGIWKTICLLGARAGLRREEIHTLKWEDIDFVKNRIHITPKDGWEPKDYAQRFIGMPPDLREYLAGLNRTNDYILGENRPSLAVMSSYFKKLARQAGLKGSIHILRHTYASHLAQAGVPLKTIKDLLGHSNIATTEIYAELMPENIDEAAKKLPDLS